MQMDQLVHEVHAGRQMQYGNGKMHLNATRRQIDQQSINFCKWAVGLFLQTYSACCKQFPPHSPAAVAFF